MKNKFEQLIEYVINDEEQKASDLFHEIVVEKSRSIYESMMDEEDGIERDEAEDMLNDIKKDEIGEADDEAEFGDEGAPEDDDFNADGELDDHEGDHDELEDRVADLENELDDLMAEFDKIVGDDEMGGEEEMPMDMGEPEDEEMMAGMYGESEEVDEDAEEVTEEDEQIDEEATEDLDEAIQLQKVSKGIAGTTEGESVGSGSESVAVNKATINNDNAGKAGATVHPVKTDTSEENGRTADSAKDMGYTPTQEAGKKAYKSKAPTAKTKGEDGGTNKTSP
nr:hypothetical protein [Acidimicrobiia bacterium]